MRILVTGGRDFEDQALLESVLDSLQSMHHIEAVLHGDASGADRLAGQWAKSRNIAVEAYPADWKKFGRAAGPIRNQKMLDENPDILIAFPGGKGTADMVSRAKKAGLVVVVVEG